jgi:hypothetical protein
MPHIMRPQGAFGVRQLAAAFENNPMHPVFKSSMESGSKLPHSERFGETDDGMNISFIYL